MPKRNLIWILAILAAAAVAAYVARSPVPAGRAPAQGEFSPVERTYQLIHDSCYPAAEDNDALCRAAVRGMVSSLDEFSSYIPPEMSAQFESRVMGTAQGVGLRLESLNGAIGVAEVLPSSPARQSFIAVGERVLGIDGKPVASLTVEQAETLLAGKLGTKVELRIAPADGGEPRTVTLVRAKYPIETIEGLLRDESGRWICLIDAEDGIGYVRIREFTRDTAEKLKGLMRELPQTRSLVLDLRDNPGGLLPAAVEAADMFLRKGTIMTVVDRTGRHDRCVAREDGTLPDMPLVVLVNARTASAAEIVAGSLRLQRRAVLVGTRTRGKGCIQSLLTLPGNLGQVNLTTAEFLVGDSRRIMRRPCGDSWGIDPHVEVVLSPTARTELDRLREKIEPAAPASKKTSPSVTSMSAPQNPRLRAMLRQDLPLARAVSLLRHPAEMEKLLDAGALEDRARDSQPATQASQDSHE
jgi:carboxyl-terminal processing protease